METKEVLKKVKRIEIKTRGLVNSLFSGEYHTIFKGRGMSFAEVREYQFGDEIRFIDWNVSARMDRPYVKQFEEEREQTLMVLFDASGSSRFGTEQSTKLDTMIEMSALVAFSAIKNNDKVGLLIFTDRVEKFIPPKKGKGHVLRLIRELLMFKPVHSQTRISEALEYTLHVLRRRSIVFLMSDFIDRDFHRPLRTMARKHDLIAIKMFDRMEREVPAVGLVLFEDKESGRILEVDTADEQTRILLRQRLATRGNELKQLFRQNRIDLIEIQTGMDYVEAFTRFFRKRERRLARG